MSEFNLLKEAFIINDTVTSGIQRDLTIEEMEKLILSYSGPVLTFSGSVISLSIDLGSQKATKELVYSINPVSTSGLFIEYGRDLDDLTEASYSILPYGIKVEPTISGYTYPRYFKLRHSVGSSPVTVSGLDIINDELDINFGQDGSLQSRTLVGNLLGGTSDIQEIYVRNDGTISTDIYVSVDTSNTETSILDNFEMSSTSTGIFVSYSDNLSIPNSIPWEWGLFENTTVDNKGSLKVVDDIPKYDYEVNETISILSELNDTENNYSHTEKCLDVYNNPVVIRMRENHSIVFVDPIKNTRIVSSNPSYSVSGTYEQHFMHPAWGGDDYIYFLNGKSTREIQRYSISNNTFSVLTTTSFYNRASRAALVNNGYLYIAGSRNTEGSTDSVGDQFWRVSLNTFSEERLADLPTIPVCGTGPKIVYLDNYIYYTNGYTGTTKQFWRYNISLNLWEMLTKFPNTTEIRDISVNEKTHEIFVLKYEVGVTTLDVFKHNSLSWIQDAITLSTTQNTNKAGGLSYNNYFYYYTSNGDTKVKILSALQRPNTGATISGSWTSPALRLHTEDTLYKIVFDINEESTLDIRADTSIDLGNFRVRGSNLTPSAQNLDKAFDSVLSTDEFVIGNTSDSIAVVSGGALTFSHLALDNDLNSSYVYMGFPFFYTTGSMQYRFWWNPPSNRTNSSTKKSKFYIVPYLDTLGTGIEAGRDPDSLERSGSDFLYISFGQDSDFGGDFTKINFFNGSSETSYDITAQTGKFYEVILLVNWESGNYHLYFNTQYLGGGNIQQVKIAALLPTHSYEFFSTGEGVNFDEKIRHLIVSRVGLDPLETSLSVPVCLEDPVFGIKDDSWYNISINSTILPKNEFIQFKISMLGTGNTSSKIDSIKFSPIIKLEDVPVSGSKPVYIRYNFPSLEQKSTNIVRLKAWMATDKL